jgi:hypothetical protein
MPTSDQMSTALEAVTGHRLTPGEACRAIGGGPADLADLLLAERLRDSVPAELPSPAYWRRLEGRLRLAQQQQVASVVPPRRRPWRSPLLGLATAAVLALALGLATFVVAPPQPVSAQAILAKARAAAGPANGRVQSFAMTLVATGPDDLAATPATPQPAPGDWRREDRTWYQAPDRWRSETRFLRRPDGSRDAGPSILVADGRDIWSYDAQHLRLQVNPGRLGGPTEGGIGLYGAAGSLSAVLAQASCFPHPAFAGTTLVAGRPTAIVDLARRPARATPPATTTAT